ncbi:YbfA family protein [Rouxiella silvae]|uniref:YbfA family protein n=1 Tax=Rouxiella silvae TaxID=1646373 RepID=A0AA40WYW0_9GAMM|nr:YbfA family protein [Rouxiella silvae]MBF6635394.1 YbfA family protein [Rouxiella silvae]
MSDYTPYSLSYILLRRTLATIIGVLAMPIMAFRSDRARFYSHLHRVWAKTSNKPVWLAQTEITGQYFY